MASYIGYSDILQIAQTIGIVGTLLITLIYSNKQIKGLSVDIETKVLSDLDEKVHRLEEHLLDRPELGKVINRHPLSPEAVYSFDVLNVFSHAFDMHERKVLNENEWLGWIHWMRTCFREGTIKEHWKQIQQTQWYDPLFEDFINKQVIAYVEGE
ncbi:MAG: hypothetical protein M3Z01_00250 [Thermoproteota archaeon]|nr:hypothetical protein [Thermoproteota archaeon]